MIDVNMIVKESQGSHTLFVPIPAWAFGFGTYNFWKKIMVKKQEIYKYIKCKSCNFVL